METTVKAKGRPRAFDTDEALERALHLFWRQGYEGTSMADLTEAMGISSPSLYAAFGNKEALFRQALDRYVSLHACFLEQALAAPTARETAAAILERSVEFMTRRGQPRGCLTVQGGITGGEAAEPIKRALTLCRHETEVALRKRFERAVAEGDLPADADPAALACYLMTINQGLSVQAVSGASRAELAKVAEIALRAWPV
ncbi:MAG TPA: TetR/AcrR family transcriptional regulator [Hypericibacter adhaerens]|jgi:AcrR family transcriptional regulator|uniref:TetR/AcrR family transcriptional regulator n=1 Tax=Hypericibacter adhaerens TaxID=2602016 RepID=UPI002BAE89CB|nr:TetR/AcrR family transcriptional regulator [Hypericibacter adhaerens]HWA42002.1 TetR/AcrR family transcriptional regulator [Hypericibacter adhaerens]